MLPYPFSYFSSIWGFRKPLSKRFELNWFQLLFTSIFLISLSMVPIAIQNSSQETYPLETFIDNVYEPLTDKVVQDLSEHATIKELPKDLQLHFDTNELVISKESKELTRISYRAIQTESFKSKDSLTQAISKDWYQQNRVYISLFLVLGASFLFGLNFFIVSLGASLLLYITKKSRLFSFRTFKECYHFILNCLGLPTLITLILGLFGQNMTTLITVQNILFVLYLVTIFYKTHFRDPNYHK
ncbi:malA-protein [Streptococcus pneumoniae]|nr:malA-protein [Streptococcus pneumoniae]